VEGAGHSPPLEFNAIITSITPIAALFSNEGYGIERD